MREHQKKKITVEGRCTKYMTSTLKTFKVTKKRERQRACHRSEEIKEM